MDGSVSRMEFPLDVSVCATMHGRAASAKAKPQKSFFSPSNESTVYGRRYFLPQIVEANDPDQMKLIPEFLEGITYFIHRAEELGLRDKLVIIP